MADDLDLSVDGDLAPILTRVVEVLERRSAETPDERSIRLQLGGNADVAAANQLLAAKFEAVRDASTVAEFRAAMNNLPAENRWAQATQLRNNLNLLRGRDGAGALPSSIAAAARSALDRTATTEADLQAEKTRLQAAHGKAKNAGDKARPALTKAIADLKKGLTDTELRALRTKRDQAASRLALAEEVLSRSAPSAKDTDWAKTQRKRIATLTVELAEADPNRVVLTMVRDVMDKLPTGTDGRELLGGLADEVAVGIMDRSVKQRRQNLSDGLSELQRAGGLISRTVNVSLGAELGALGIGGGAKAKLGYSYTIALSRTSSGAFQATITHKGSVGASGKVGKKGAAQAKLTGDASVGRAETFSYATEAELVADLSSTLLKMAVGAGRSDAMESQAFEKRRNKKVADTVVNRARLVDQMTRVDATASLPADRQDAPLAARSIERDNRVRSTQWTGQLKLGASGELGDLGMSDAGVGKGTFEASGAIAFKISRTRQFKELPYLDSLLDSPLEIELEANQGSGLARHTDSGTESHAAAKVYYDQLMRRAQGVTLADGQGDEAVKAEAADIRKRVRSDMQRLAVEFDMFAQLRHLHTEPGPNDPNAEKLYRQMLADRGLGRRDKNKTARMAKAMMLQYAMLRNIYEATGSGDEDDAAFRSAMTQFEDRVRNPPFEMSNDERRAAFGDEAATDASVKATTTATIKASYGGGAAREGTRTSGPLTDKVGFGGLGGDLMASLSYSTTPGKPNSSSLGITLDFSTDALGGGGGRDNEINDDFAEKLAGDLAAKVLDRNVLRKLAGTDGGQEQVVAEVTQAIKESLKGAAGRIQISMAPVDGKWRLKTVAAVERSKTGMKLGGTIPVGPTNIAISVGVHQAKSRVQAVYHSPHTLSSLTDLHRLRQPGGNGSSAGWDAMRKDSNQLANVLDKMAETSGDATTIDGSSLVDVLRKLKAGTLVEADERAWRLQNASSANELVPWLLGLKTESADRASAADAFIDGYLASAQNLGPSATAADRAAAIQGLEPLLSGVVAAKRASEDEAVSKKFIKKRGLSRDKLNDIVADKLADKFFDLEMRVFEKLNPGATDEQVARDWVSGSKPSLAAMKRRLLKARKDNPDDPDLVELEIQTRSLEGAIETLDDLTRHNTESGKNAALARLGKTVDTVFTEPKIYLGENMHGEVVRRRNGSPWTDDAGRIKIRPHVAADRAGVLTPESISSSLDHARHAEGGDVLDIRPHVAIDLGGDKARYWTKRDANERDRSVMVAERRTEGNFATKARAERDIKKKKKRSGLAEAFAIIVEAQAERKRRRLLLKRIQQRKRDDARDDD